MQLALCWRPLRTGGGGGEEGFGEGCCCRLAPLAVFPEGSLRPPPPRRSRVPWELPPTSRSLRWPVPQVREAGRGYDAHLSRSGSAGPATACGVCGQQQYCSPPYPLPRPRFKKPPPCGSAHTGFKAPPTTRLAPPLSLERALLIPRWCILVTLLGATQGPIKATINRITNELGFDSCTMEIHEGDKTWFTF